MPYELAKELKDAGFPILTFKEMSIPNTTVYQRTFHGDEYLLEPTLSELIEACGESFWKLELRPHTKKWKAMASNAVMLNNCSQFGYGIEGDTPEEAVARLWLALNKK